MGLQEETAAHDARNVVLLAKLVDKGVDLLVTRVVDLQFWANSEFDATKLAKALRVENVEVTRTAVPFGTNSRWSVEARIEASPYALATRDCTEWLVQFAAAHNAQYDGWGTEV